MSGGSLPTAHTSDQAYLLLESVGAFLIDPGAVPNHVVTSLNECLKMSSTMSNTLSYPVKAPDRRQHLLLVPQDCKGSVGSAVGAIAQWMHGSMRMGTLAELGAFIVSYGAQDQQLHTDRHEAGYVSCQLALHDTRPGSGGLAVHPGSVNAPSALEVVWLGNHILDAWQAEKEEVEVAPLRAGTVVCYDGRLWHRGLRHTGLGTQRRALYFTARTSQGGGILPSRGHALHPTLRFGPQNNMIPLEVFATNYTSASKQ